MTKQQHYEWTKLDTYDSTTDYYKHLRTKGQLERFMVKIGGKHIFAANGGNGVEVRCEK